MKDFYTIKEISDMYSVSTRTVERHIKELIVKEKNKNLIPLDVVKLLEVRHYSDIKKIEVGYDVVEGFSKEEYQEFQKRLIEYPMLKKELEYHKKSAESHQRQMERILNIMHERNFLEAIDKTKLKE